MTNKATNSDQEIWEFLQDNIRDGVVEVQFEKADGTMREMVCTLNEGLIDYEFKSDAKTVITSSNPNDGVMTVWDIEAAGWRKLTRGKIRKIDIYETDEESDEGGESIAA